MNIMAIKVSVKFDIGRKSKDCTGAGICSITVSAELALKPSQDLGVLEWEPGASNARLSFKGRETLHEQGMFALWIDRAIYLPLGCGANDPDWFVRRGRYLVKTDNRGEYIELQLAAVPAI